MVSTCHNKVCQLMHKRPGCQTPAEPRAPCLLPCVENVPGLIKENRRFVQKPCELTASTTLSWVKCCICILMGCYRVINAPVRLHYPRSELKGSLPNRLSLQKEVLLSIFEGIFKKNFVSLDASPLGRVCVRNKTDSRVIWEFSHLY